MIGRLESERRASRRYFFRPVSRRVEGSVQVKISVISYLGPVPEMDSDRRRRFAFSDSWPII